MTDAVREKLIEYVRGRLPQPERLAMLAEEAAELGHAALKLRRALDGTNPTPVTVEEAQAALQEEVADVLLLIFPVMADMAEIIREIQDVKLRRWADRLAEKETDR